MGAKKMPVRFKKQLGERIQCKRRLCSLTQADLARAAKVSRESVSMWESGGMSPSLPVLCRVADTLGVSTDWLLGRE